MTRALTERIVLVGVMLVVGAFWLFIFELAHGASVGYARTAAVNVFVFGEMTYLFNCRSLRRSWWSMGAWSNPWVWFGFITMFILQIGFTYLPPMQAAFETAPLRIDTWTHIVAVALLVSTVVALEKLLRLRLGKG